MNPLFHEFTQQIRICAFCVFSVRVTDVGGKTGPVSMLVRQDSQLFLGYCELSDLEGRVAVYTTPGISDRIRHSK